MRFSGRDKMLPFTLFLLLFCGGTAFASKVDENVVIRAERHLPRVLRSTGKPDDCESLLSKATLDDIATCDGTIIVIDQGNSPLDLSSATDDQVEKIFKFGNNDRRELLASLTAIGSDLSKLRFTWRPQKSEHFLKIENNHLLTEIERFIQFKSGTTPDIHVTGNRRLSVESLTSLKEILQAGREYKPPRVSASSYVQDFGECLVSVPLKSFDELKDCVYIKGDLSIDSNTKLSSQFPDNLTRIDGCLKLIGTKLASLQFLENFNRTSCTTGHEISMNSICIHPEFEDTIRSNFQDKVTITNDPKCEAECSSSYLLSKKNPKCVVVTDTLTITGMKKTDTTSHLEGIKTIRGRLVIILNEMENFDFFKKLTTVIANGSTGSEPTIEVKFNNNMKKFTLPAIKNVYTQSSSQKALYFGENGKFKMDNKTKKDFEKRLGTENVFVFEEQAREVIVERNSTTNGTNHRVATEEKEKEESNMALIVGLSVGGAVLLLILLVVGAGLAFYFLRKKKAPKEIESKMASVHMDPKSIQQEVVEDPTKQFSSVVIKMSDSDRFPASIHFFEKLDHIPENTQTFFEENTKKNAEEREKRRNLTKTMKKGKADATVDCTQDEDADVYQKIEAEPVEVEKRATATTTKKQETPRTQGGRDPRNPRMPARRGVGRGRVQKKKQSAEVARPLESGEIQAKGLLKKTRPKKLEPKPERKPRNKWTIEIDETQSGESSWDSDTVPFYPAERKKEKRDLKREQAMAPYATKLVTYEGDFQRQCEENNVVISEKEIAKDWMVLKYSKLSKVDTTKSLAAQAVIDHFNSSAVYPFVSRFEKEHWKNGIRCKCDLLSGIENPVKGQSKIFGKRLEDHFATCKSEPLKAEDEGNLRKEEKMLNMLSSPIVFEMPFKVTAVRMMADAQDSFNEEMEYLSATNKQAKTFSLSVPQLTKKGEKGGKGKVQTLGYNVEFFEFKNAKDIGLKEVTVIKVGLPEKNTSDEEFLKRMINALSQGDIGKWVSLTKEYVLRLCSLAKDKDFQSMKTITEWSNVRIIGEVRGKFDDLRKALSIPVEQGKEQERRQLVFLGNYVGNSVTNVETICLLFALKAFYGIDVVLLRGMTEWREINIKLKFVQELEVRFPNDHKEIYEAINLVFDGLPFSLKIGENLLCLHSGVASQMTSLNEIKTAPTKLAVDTVPFNLTFAHPNYTVKTYFDNYDLRAGYYFGERALNDVCGEMKVDAVFVSKALNSGWGRFGSKKVLFSLCSAFNLQKDCVDLRAAVTDIDSHGNVTMRVMYQMSPDVKVIEQPPLLKPLKDKAASSRAAPEKSGMKSTQRSAQSSGRKSAPPQQQQKSKSSNEKSPAVQQKSKSGPPKSSASKKSSLLKQQESPAKQQASPTKQQASPASDPSPNRNDK